jgi:osmotically-inducible protein OsmY
MTRKLIAVFLVAAAAPAMQACAPLAVGAAAGGAVIMANDRRTTGTYIDDESIEWRVSGRIRDKYKAAHVNATSYNRRVLLTGEALTEDDKKAIEAAARATENVREVTNEVQVAGNSSFASRGNDALITTNVKARMINNPKFSPTHVKVVTEAGVVYLMGLVTTEEGDAMVEIARTTAGVNRVVKVFEYINKS